MPKWWTVGIASGSLTLAPCRSEASQGRDSKFYARIETSFQGCRSERYLPPRCCAMLVAKISTYSFGDGMIVESGTRGLKRRFVPEEPTENLSLRSEQGSKRARDGHGSYSPTGSTRRPNRGSRGMKAESHRQFPIFAGIQGSITETGSSNPTALTGWTVGLSFQMAGTRRQTRESNPAIAVGRG